MAEKGLKKWIITFTVITASLLELIDTTIVNVAIPQIQGNLGATLEDVAWLSTGYAVANVIVLPMSGWLGSRFGRKNYFLFSIILFTIASFLCGNATNLEELIAFRILQGLAGGGLISTAQAILIETWPREDVGIATALFGLGAVVGPTVGPTIGGYLLEISSWPLIFYVNIPVGILAAYCTYTFVRETPKDGKGMPVDWWGILLLAVAVGSLQTVLEKGESEDWFATPYIVALAVASVLGLILFIWRELSTDHPIVNFKIMRHRSFSVGMFTSFILGFGLYGSVFVFPIFCQNLLGFSPLQTGELLFPGGLCTIVMMPFIGIMLKKNIPAQFMATIGMFLFFVFCSMLSRSTLQSGPNDFFFPLMIRGVGMALLFVPLTTLAIQDLKGAEIGQGAGLNNMMRQLGGSFGIAALTTLIHVRQGFHRSNLLVNVNEYNPAFTDRFNAFLNNFMAKGYSYLDAKALAIKAIDGTVTKQSLLLTYSDAYWVAGLILLCSIPLLYLQKFKKNVEVPADLH
ncbi:DHA2 family efflux MFS transporter permease subunit [Pedobacter hiemivivus]|jgi:DHA2 family multidrug resistance protein|uniref:DHA2 family efflux MFS transporter permease subunit n=1 Tax=Pedobacter hiemivivus TaxID=2530454 RepID=A0A4U1G666_9SPHI|nr:DHA2 family efflux MFS transporter permease subunit [Pedobacter hiemivivus]TCC86305.1 DHA2 family efflux MFS transporter permease subunit [Pedobacter hiemivivus]TKC58033.1 DHA2 family efflux MFS transporter permease subunit [Pedobacter hiemivivus]